MLSMTPFQTRPMAAKPAAPRMIAADALRGNRLVDLLKSALKP